MSDGLVAFLDLAILAGMVYIALTLGRQRREAVDALDHAYDVLGESRKLVRQAQRDVATAFLHLTEPCGCGDYVEVTSIGDQAVLRKCMWCSREWAEPLAEPAG